MKHVISGLLAVGILLPRLAPSADDWGRALHPDAVKWSQPEKLSLPSWSGHVEALRSTCSIPVRFGNGEVRSGLMELYYVPATGVYCIGRWCPHYFAFPGSIVGMDMRYLNASAAISTNRVPKGEDVERFLAQLKESYVRAFSVRSGEDPASTVPLCAQRGVAIYLGPYLGQEDIVRDPKTGEIVRINTYPKFPPISITGLRGDGTNAVISFGGGVGIKVDITFDKDMNLLASLRDGKPYTPTAYNNDYLAGEERRKARLEEERPKATGTNQPSR
jgi:hypothetical protein